MPPSELPEEPSPAAGPANPTAVAHLDGEQLALRALGEGVGTRSDDAHLASCGRCQVELDQLRGVVGTSRSLAEDDRLLDPPDAVWQAIRAQVTRDTEDDVVSLADRRHRSWSTSVLVAASVASLMVGAVLTSVVTRDSSPGAPVPDTQVVAAAALAALPKHTGTGEAQIVTRNGTDYLKIDATDLSRGNGFYEVWLIDPRTMQMVGLGALDSAEGLFPIPSGLDLSKYRLVDVSLEPMDGQPTHSGNSIVRGELAT